jgi:hypothetical protein
MTMTEQDLRALIRETVLKALAARDAAPTPGLASSRPGHADRPDRQTADHPSYGVYVALVNVGDACLIEPAVACSHCNYCRSHGH